MERAFRWKPFGLALLAGSALGAGLAAIVRSTRLTEPFAVVAGQRYAFTLQIDFDLSTSAEAWRTAATTALLALGATNVDVKGYGPLYASFVLVAPISTVVHPGEHLYPNTAGLEAATVLSVKGPL
jgi:hypothetical protein